MTFASTLFNVIFIFYEYVIMPDRSPDVPLDLARKLVVVFEVSNVTINLCYSALIFQRHDPNTYSDKSSLVELAVASMNLLRMSCFSMIVLANPSVIKKNWDIVNLSLGWKMSHVVLHFMSMGLGFLAVAAKLPQISFLSSVDFVDWTPLQWFTILAIGNQLAGLSTFIRCVPLLPAPPLLPTSHFLSSPPGHAHYTSNH
jgi:hypothetical protein